MSTNPMKLVMWIGLFGAAGAAARIAVGRLAVHFFKTDSFPWETFICNMIGCFLLGFLIAAVPENKQWLKTAMGTGFIGSFTTFSALSMETVQLIEQQQWGALFIYVIASYFGGFLMIWTGNKASTRSPKEVSNRKENVS